MLTSRQTLCLLAGALVLSAGSAHAQTWETRDTAGLTVELYTPSTVAVQGTGRGLLLLLHGCTQQATSFRADGNLEPAAEAKGWVVALPQVPNGGVIAGCWDFYGADHTRSNRHNAYLFDLVGVLLAESALQIDPRQVYIAGLSSGAGQAVIAGCLAPDVFAGVGVNAGPMAGTSVLQVPFAPTDATSGIDTCRTLAGAQATSFQSQLASIIYGTGDFTVDRDYGALNADVYDRLFSGGAGLSQSTFDVSVLPGYMPRGTGDLWSDASGPRISLIEVEGMGHAFPAGSGDEPEQDFIARRGPHWAMILAELFSSHNRRLTPPDAGVPDAGAPLDAGLGDAGASDRDARADAGSTPDAGLSNGLDAGLPTATDAEPSDAPAGSDSSASDGVAPASGCSLTNAYPTPVSIVGLLWAIALIRRRRGIQPT